MQLEADRTMLAKLKLETLCRELQKCNKQVKEENVERLKQMEQSRQDMVDQFKASLSDIQKSMDAGKERSERLSADNQQLAAKLRELANQYEDKLKCLADQYEQKHKYAQQLATTKDMELQLADAKLDACKLNLEKSQQQKAQLEQLVRYRLTFLCTKLYRLTHPEHHYANF
jgi:chromosome segregation ATPase